MANKNSLNLGNRRLARPYLIAASPSVCEVTCERVFRPPKTGGISKFTQDADGNHVRNIDIACVMKWSSFLSQNELIEQLRSNHGGDEG